MLFDGILTYVDIAVVVILWMLLAILVLLGMWMSFQVDLRSCDLDLGSWFEQILNDTKVSE